MNERISVNPKVCHGQAFIKGTRIPEGSNKILISEYETAMASPNMENLGRIAKALDVTADYLIFDNVPNNGRVEFKRAENLSEEDRNTIKTVVDAMIVKRKVKGVVKLHP